MGQRQLRAGKIQPPRPSARRQNEFLAVKPAAVGNLDCMRIDKLRLADTGENLRPRRFEMGDQLLLLVDVVDDGLGARQQLRKVQLWARHGHPVSAVLAGVAHQAGRARQHTGRHAAVVGAGAAHAAPLDQRNRCAQLAAAQCSGHARRPAADNDQIKSR